MVCHQLDKRVHDFLVIHSDSVMVKVHIILSKIYVFSSHVALNFCSRYTKIIE